VEEKMQLHLDEERLGQLMAVAKQRGTTQSKDIQDLLAEVLAREAVAQSSLA
jgi:hypothetical protein